MAVGVGDGVGSDDGLGELSGDPDAPGSPDGSPGSIDDAAGLAGAGDNDLTGATVGATTGVGDGLVVSFGVGFGAGMGVDSGGLDGGAAMTGSGPVTAPSDATPSDDARIARTSSARRMAEPGSA